MVNLTLPGCSIGHPVLPAPRLFVVGLLSFLMGYVAWILGVYGSFLTCHMFASLLVMFLPQRQLVINMWKFTGRGYIVLPLRRAMQITALLLTIDLVMYLNLTLSPITMSSQVLYLVYTVLGLAAYSGYFLTFICHNQEKMKKRNIKWETVNE